MSLQRFLGGSPGAVLIKLIFISLLVGAFMAALGITPTGLFNRLVEMVQGVFNLSFNTVKQIVLWLAYGAVVVIPIWLILRVIGYFR
jgi:hypothetical protein